MDWFSFRRIMSDLELIKEAKKARKMAYVPYSKFKVGAALLTKSGKVIHGCNIENAAYTPCNCAERTAFFKAISEGIYDFCKIAVVGGIKDADTLCTPCGVCRQVMQEFCNPKEFEILMSDGENLRKMKLEELLPFGFGPDNLNR